MQDTTQPIPLSQIEISFIQQQKQSIQATIDQLESQKQQFIKEMTTRVEGALTLMILQRSLQGQWTLNEDFTALVPVQVPAAPVPEQQ